MRPVFFFFLLLAQLSFAQQIDLSGVYGIDVLADNNTSQLQYSLELHTDGTFSFESYRNIKKQSEERLFVQGTWEAKGKLIELKGSKDMDLTNTKARFDVKSQKLVFYESKVFWIKGLRIPKLSS